MSMIGNYRRVTVAELQALLDNPDSVDEFLYDGETDIEKSGNHIDVDKAWHAIHFLLNGKTWEGTPPLHNAVLGGKELGDKDVGYGPARYLTPKEVRETAAAIAGISRADLVSRYSGYELAKADVYPSWDDLPENKEYIGSYYEMVVNFFKATAAAGDGMLLYIN